MAPITDRLKNNAFLWTPAVTKAFKEVKMLIAEALVMHLSDFSKAFETCDASGLAISGVLSQENHLVAYFSEKLNDT